MIDNSLCFRLSWVQHLCFYLQHSLAPIFSAVLHLKVTGTVITFNPLTPRVKSWVMKHFLTFDSMDRFLKCDHSLESCLSSTLLWGSLFFSFSQVVIFDSHSREYLKVFLVIHLLCVQPQTLPLPAILNVLEVVLTSNSLLQSEI